jgi:hypothetical protein
MGFTNLRLVYSSADGTILFTSFSQVGFRGALMKIRFKLVFLVSLLIVSSVVFVPLATFFVADMFPDAVVYFIMWLNGDAVLDINVAQNSFAIVSLYWFGGFSCQLSFLILLAGATVAFLTSMAFLIDTIVIYKLKRKKGQ